MVHNGSAYSPMMTPVEDRKDDKIRVGMVHVSDGKSRPLAARLALSLEAVRVQRPRPAPPPQPLAQGPHTRERMVQVRRQPGGGLGLSIKGGAEHKLPILISRIYKDQAADHTGQLFVGDAVIKVNGEFITACAHDDAVAILRDAGDIVVLTVKHYRAAMPFLATQAEATPDTDGSAGEGPGGAQSPGVATAAATTTSTAAAAPTALDDNCNVEGAASRNNGPCDWQSAESSRSRPCSALGSALGSRPPSVASDVAHPDPNDDNSWVDVATVPLMMGYVTRYVLGTDKLRPNAFEVRGARGESTGVVHLEEPAALSMWLKSIADNVVGLTNLQMKLFNRHLSAGERIEYMGWVVEGVMGTNGAGGGAGGGRGQRYRPTFLVLKGTNVLLFEQPPTSLAELAKCPEVLKVYQTMFRVVKESETVDWRQHCFLVQSGAGAGPAGGGGGGGSPRYFSAETRQELLRVEAAWTATIVNTVVRLGKKTFTVVFGGRAASLTLDWAAGFALHDGAGAPPAPALWAYRFSQLRGSSDDGKSKLKLHFQDAETKAIETKELECQILQSLLFCMHAFLTAKVASVDPAFLASVHQAH